MKQHRIVVGCPAGRKETLELLFAHVLKNRPFVDEFRIWVNTTNESDLEYIKQLSEQYPDFVTRDHSADGNTNQGRNVTVCLFFPNCIDENTVYFKVDDDVVWLEENFFEKMYEFRIQNQEYPIIFANTVNNAICDYIHQHLGLLLDVPYIWPACGDPVGWSNGEYCVLKHKEFLSHLKNGQIHKYKFEKWIARQREQISINNICWFGKDFAKFEGNVGIEDERWLSCVYPDQLGKFNCINGNALCVHYSFGPQLEYVKQSGILQEYKNLI
jgi:hypothetical protein